MPPRRVRIGNGGTDRAIRMTNGGRLIGNLLDSAAGCLRWAEDLLAGDGSFVGAEDSLGPYYLGGLAYTSLGRPDVSARIITYARDRFLVNGDINDVAGQFDSPVANFRNSFFCLSAQRSGFYGVAGAIADRLQRGAHPATGGIPDNDDGARVIEMGTTAAAIVALLAAGRQDAATKAGDFLADSLVAGQPDLDGRVLLRKNWDGEWIDKFPAADSARYQILLGVPGQIYWFFGISMAALGQLYSVTGKKSHLEAATTVFEWAKQCQPGSFADLTAAKVGWGASVLYAVTGGERFAKAASQVGAMLVETRDPGGYWLRRPMVVRLEDQDVATTLDTSLERVCWLSEIARNLAAGAAAN